MVVCIQTSLSNFNSWENVKAVTNTTTHIIIISITHCSSRCADDFISTLILSSGFVFIYGSEIYVCDSKCQQFGYICAMENINIIGNIIKKLRVI